MRPTDRQWAVIENLLPKAGSRRRPAADNRACVEGILWVPRSGARWRDLPPQYPGLTTCVGYDSGRSGASGSTPGAGCWVRWTRRGCCRGKKHFWTEKRGLAVGKTKRGKGTKAVVLADGEGIPLGICITSATPNEVTLAEPTLAGVRIPRCGRRPRMRAQRIIADRAYDSDPLLRRLRRRGIELIIPYR